jgi:hypothetical protein
MDDVLSSWLGGIFTLIIVCILVQHYLNIIYVVLTSFYLADP